MAAPAPSPLCSTAMPSTDPAFARDLSDDKIAALVEIMYLAATADGEFSKEEREQFVQNAERLTANLVTGDRLENILAQAQAALDASGRDDRLRAVKDRLPDAAARKLALALAIQVTAVDGIIRTSERELILETADALGIDGETAADMVRDLTRK